MQEDRDYTVYPSDLNIPVSFDRFNNYLVRAGYKPMKQKTSSHALTIHDGNHRRLYAENFEEFLETLKHHPKALPIYIHYNWYKTEDDWISTIIEIQKSGIYTSVRSLDLDKVSSIHDRIKECFQASNPDGGKSPEIYKNNFKKSIFLAHRFDDYGNKIAANLNKFLCRLGFDVKEGGGYETKSIPEKVGRKISAQDIFICVFTPGETTWILSEAAYAKALNKYVILICEENLEVNKGIIGGDYEHLLFPVDNIEKCFSDLLYSLPS